MGKLTKRSFDLLKENPNNPRVVTDKRTKSLEKALKEFGDLGCIIFNRKTKQLVGGHQRVKIIKENGSIHIDQEYKKANAQGTIAEGHIIYNGEKFKYREVIWDRTKESAANIAANNNAGEWDLPLLSDMVREIDFDDFDLELTMLDSHLLEDLVVPTVHPKKGKEEEPKPSKKNAGKVSHSKCPECGHMF